MLWQASMWTQWLVNLCEAVIASAGRLDPFTFHTSTIVVLLRFCCPESRQAPADDGHRGLPARSRHFSGYGEADGPTSHSSFGRIVLGGAEDHSAPPSHQKFPLNLGRASRASIGQHEFREVDGVLRISSNRIWAQVMALSQREPCTPPAWGLELCFESFAHLAILRQGLQFAAGAPAPDWVVVGLTIG